MGVLVKNVDGSKKKFFVCDFFSTLHPNYAACAGCGVASGGGEWGEGRRRGWRDEERGKGGVGETRGGGCRSARNLQRGLENSRRNNEGN